jgi:hypothetical protein
MVREERMATMARMQITISNAIQRRWGWRSVRGLESGRS